MTGYPFTVTLKEESVTVRCHALAARRGTVVAATLSGDVNALEEAWDLMRDGGLVSCNGKTYAGADIAARARRQIQPYRTAVLFLRDNGPLYLWSRQRPHTEELYITLLRHFTTPLLPEWMPWVARNLLQAGNLPEIGVFGMHAHHLNLTQAQLDETISFGLRFGCITIPAECNT